MAAGADYESLGKPELQEEARRRGLPVSGTKEELTARLVEHDQTQPAGDDGDSGDPDDPFGLSVEGNPNDGPDTTPEDPPGDPMEPEHTEVEAPRPIKAFRVEYPTPHGLPTQTHLDLVRRAHGDAIAAGYRPRGGANSAMRVGSGVSSNGEPTTIYEVPVHKQ